MHHPVPFLTRTSRLQPSITTLSASLPPSSEHSCRGHHSSTLPRCCRHCRFPCRSSQPRATSCGCCHGRVHNSGLPPPPPSLARTPPPPAKLCPGELPPTPLHFPGATGMLLLETPSSPVSARSHHCHRCRRIALNPLFLGLHLHSPDTHSDDFDLNQRRT